MQYAIIDIEATGGSPKRDKITEIAIFLYDGTQVIDQFSTLINPGIKIPPFITRLTGITNKMVATAPSYGEVAERILEITKDAVFVAHNVQFDYAYVKAEFKRLGISFRREKLCTIVLAKRIFPNMDSYSLGNICEDLDILLEDRHRATGDAAATVKLFEKLLHKDTENFLYDSMVEVSAYQNLPPHLPATVLDGLPEETGIYFFHDKDNSVNYISRSNDIRRRIFQHFKGKSTRYWKMLMHTYDISHEETGSDLIAQLLEIHEIKRLRPRFNRRGRSNRFSWGLFKEGVEQGYDRLAIRRKKAQDHPIAVYDKEEDAKSILWKKVKHYKLCPVLCGLKEEQCDSCAKMGGVCNGACLGKESVARYNQRLGKALKEFRYTHPNFLIIGEGRHLGEFSVVCVENHRYKGFTYTTTDAISDVEVVRDGLNYQMQDPGVDRIIIEYLKKNKLDKVVRF